MRPSCCLSSMAKMAPAVKLSFVRPTISWVSAGRSPATQRPTATFAGPWNRPRNEFLPVAALNTLSVNSPTMRIHRKAAACDSRTALNPGDPHSGDGSDAHKIISPD